MKRKPLRPDVIIIAVLLIGSLAYIAYEFLPGIELPWRAKVAATAHFPGAFGLEKGRAVTLKSAPGNPKIGEVAEIEPVEDGVLLHLLLDPGTPLTAGALLVLKPMPSPQLPLLELVLPATGEPSPSERIDSKIEASAPDGMLEPAPRWPFELAAGDTSLDTCCAEWCRKAQDALAKRRFDDAILFSRRALAISPFSSENAYLLAAGLWHTGRYGEAMSVLKPLVGTLAEGPERSKIVAAFGASALAVGLYAEASEAFTAIRGTDIDPSSREMASILFNLALAERKRGNAANALALLDEAEKADLDLLLLKAAALADMSRFDEAKRILEIASAASPVAALNYAVLLRTNGETRKSIQMLEQISEIWKNEALVEYHLAKSLEFSGKKDQAATHYSYAAELAADTWLANLMKREADRLAVKPNR